MRGKVCRSMKSVKRILCFGDSNTWGYIAGSAERYPSDIRWTGLIAKALGEGYEIVEEGQNGRTTVWDDPAEGEKNGLRYLEPCLESQKPLDLVILFLGSNDLKVKFSLGSLEIALGVERLIRMVKMSESGPGGRAPEILILAPPVMSPQGDLVERFEGGPEKARRLAGHLEALSKRYGCAFLDTDPHVELDMIDGVHLSAAGHKKLAAAILVKIAEIFSNR